MQDDPTLQGESTETPSATPAGTQTSDQGGTVNQNGAANPSPEEAQWNSLTGNSQERFREVTRANNELRRKQAELEARMTQFQNTRETQSVPLDPSNPEIADAVRKLDNVGIATKQYAESVMDQKLMGLVYKMELDRLEGKHDGEDGLPKFDRDEYQDFVARHPQYKDYNPEDVYQKMYEPEIFDWRVNHQSRPNGNQSSTLRPTKTQVREDELTPEEIERRLNEPDGRRWYEQNINKINAVLAKTHTPSW